MATSGPYPPTAVQAEVSVHETPRSPLTWACGGLAAGWAVQAVPFHVSARVRRPPLFAKEKPTAVQSPDAGHETPLSCDSKVPVGAGRRRIVQADPSHVPTPGLVPESPTATQALAAVQDTENSRTGNLAVLCWLQVLPFHPSASGPRPSA